MLHVYFCVHCQDEAASNKQQSQRLIVASGLVETLHTKFGTNLTVVATFPGSVLEGCSYKHPLYDRVSPVVIGGDYITTESGTGLVHTAPGHGQEDYQVGVCVCGDAAAINNCTCESVTFAIHNNSCGTSH